MDCSPQTPPSMGFSRQGYWSELPFPSLGDLPDPGLNPGLPHCRQRLYCLSHQGNKECLIQISPGCPLEGLLLKLKLQYFGHMMRRADSLEKTLMLGKIEGRRRRVRQRMRWLDGITDSMDMGLGGLQEMTG